MKSPMFTPDTGMISNEEFLYKIQSINFDLKQNNHNIFYYNTPAAFDIETSSFYVSGNKQACMYIWQFGILNWVTYGRTWDDFIKLLYLVSTILGIDNNHRLIVYIQNLGYEFQFMRKHFNWDKIFFLEERKPVYALTNGIEFRCSLKLSGKSLENIGKDLRKYKVQKRVGDLDYEKLRTSTTPVYDIELGYCENDIRVLLSYIQEKIESDGDITKIPLTKTGYVRNYCRKACFSHYGDYKHLMSLLTLEPNEYNQLKRGFQGGFTHASAKYFGKVLKDVGSYDFTSSYPAVMLSEKFPMSKSKIIEKIDNHKELEYYLLNYCCLFDVTFNNIVPKLNYDHPISISKCYKKDGEVVDNGRVVCAKSITITVTEQDFLTYKAFYDWDDFTIHNMRIYKKGYLPKDFILSILNLYKSKTILKGVDGEELNYLLSKEMLNSAYGMTVTDIVRDEINYSDNEYDITTPNLDEEIEKYNNSKKRFLFYPWGVWVTAYARANLFSGILAFGDDYIYADTDSIKAINYNKHKEYINNYNKRIKKKLLDMAKFHNIDKSFFSPVNKKGEPKQIGVWDFEGVYDEFKTIGAKRYLCRKGDNWSLTVAGLNKKKAMNYLLTKYKDPMGAFNDGLNIPCYYSGRITSTYIDEETEGYVKDYLGKPSYYNELSSIHMEQSEYELTISDEYKAFIDALLGFVEESY